MRAARSRSSAVFRSARVSLVALPSFLDIYRFIRAILSTSFTNPEASILTLLGVGAHRDRRCSFRYTPLSPFRQELFLQCRKTKSLILWEYVAIEFLTKRA
jgi:hypothetical protein